MSGVMELGARDPRQVGPYRLLQKLGGGGQGTVYLGTDGGDERVAVKVLNTDFDDTGRLKSTLNRELLSAQSVAAFVTAGVITFDLDADPPYIVTEFVDGPTLQEDVLSGRGPLRGSRLNDLAIQTVIALEAIHGANVVHCDFKPANIILGPSGVKVIDFGIARAWEQVHQAASRVIGSAHFMAPEQVENQPLGPPVDMFAWASTMVFAATGKYAFPGGSPVAVGVAVVQAEPRLHGLNGQLAELVRACLRKNPLERPTAAQVRQALMAPPGQRPATGDPVAYQPGSATPYMPVPQSPAPPARPVEPTIYELPVATAYPTAAGRPMAPPPPPRRNGGKIALTFFLVLLILAGAGVSGYLWWDRAQRREATGSPGGSDPVSGGGTDDPNLAVLQAFAGDQPLAECVVGTPNDRQLARRGCTVDGMSVTYALYKKTSLRDAERAKVQNNHDHNSPQECLSQTGISPDNRRGRYIEYTYKAGDDNRWYAAIWWDDGESRADGATVLTMRTPWDQKSADPAQSLRQAWLSWGYRLAD
ncbi:serine/threonine-protein kinase [Actinoplanes sp. NPDC089786]|uniref:serine/threonine-protein kinase n=1 Tax=Actinoplanes sp. NPDC089786 TaxID=3155185 RepID=UPI00342B878B